MKPATILKLILILIFGALCFFASWKLKPVEYSDPVPADTVYIPADSANIIKTALQGQIVGTYDDLKKRGYIVDEIRWRDSLNIVDSVRFIDSVLTVSTLSTKDTLNFSGVDMLNGDTLRVNLRVRVNTLALLAPVNAVQNIIIIEDLQVIVPPPPEATLIELAWEYRKELGLFAAAIYLIAKL